MAVVPSFPLFDLPFLVLKEIISYMCPVELFWMSLVSKKTADIVKQKTICHLEIIKHNLSLFYEIACKNQDGSELLKINMHDKKISCNDDFYLTIDSTFMPVKKNKDTFTIFWEDQSKVFWKMVSVLCRVFNVKSFSINFRVDCKGELYETAKNMQILESKYKVNASKIVMSTSISDDDLFGYFLEKFTDVPELYAYSNGSVYRHNNVQPESYCEISQAKWLTLEHLDLLIKYKRIRLNLLDLTNQEINQFLTKWMEVSTMENIELTVKHTIDIRLAMKGLTVKTQYKPIPFENWNPQPRKCVENQRKDGVKAICFNCYGYFHLQTYQ